MKVTIANHNSFDFIKSKKEKVEFKRNVKFFKNSTKEAMSISTSELIWIIGKLKLEYPFLDSDLLGMLNNHLEKGIFKLPETKRLKEVGRTVDSKCISTIR